MPFVSSLRKLRQAPRRVAPLTPRRRRREGASPAGRGTNVGSDTRQDSHCWGSLVGPGAWPAGAAHRTEGWLAPSASQRRRAPRQRRQSQQPLGSCVNGEILVGKKRRGFPIDFSAFGLKLTLIFMAYQSGHVPQPSPSAHTGVSAAAATGAIGRVLRTARGGRSPNQCVPTL